MSNFEPENIRTLGRSPRTFIDPNVSHMVLDEPIPASFKAPVLTPARGGSRVKKSIGLSVEDKIKQELRKFNDWIVSFIPEPIKKTVSDKMKVLKDKISNIYNAPRSPRELKSAFKGKTKTFRIEGGSAVDYKTFLQRVKESTVTLLNKQDKPTKVRLLIQCQF